jgi:hypothetical protein
MIITVLVYESIRSQIAQHPPERGGALFGQVPRHTSAITCNHEPIQI